jgi:hypothetical protein
MVMGVGLGRCGPVVKGGGPNILTAASAARP